MPNWCVGTLKVRGDKENIRNFLRGAFVCPVSMFSTEKPTIEEQEGLISVTAPGLCHHFYIKGSRRNFINSNSIEWYTDEQILLIPEYEAAWGIDTDVLTDLSVKYQIDIKIYAFEKGMQFNHDFEVHKGKIIKNKEITFDCYDWECVCPELGG
ncbi:hypothetical protein M5W68_18405 [Paenibacillus larvae]|uniref:hypothetical protein n=2 Tax=Paenibacillus larvae TaxID=1464 RepID=UPI00228196D2|nr:hypothetical protein [Paenibacillus larvae]MCY9527024.1 hypothetical protein [Paenibacillus larvae]